MSLISVIIEARRPWDGAASSLKGNTMFQSLKKDHVELRTRLTKLKCSITVGWTPSVARRRLMTWHMQHDERLKMIRGFSDISHRILASVISATSMDNDIVDVVAVVLVRSTNSLQLMPCISVIFTNGIRLFYESL
ncbi:hypothetical protein MRB53_017067 [Persea americana]|uniref:Uncharacterized protein n=1 Tax=Persea americana TaxID=3435 RepID=A0ACC2M3Z1_PERAE|nr:hypothetical protein MRB53_017067 [Persea americana]